MGRLLVLFIGFVMPFAPVWASTDGFVYEGLLTDASNNPVTVSAPGLTFRFRIIGKVGGTECLLWEQSKSLPVTDGHFATRLTEAGTPYFGAGGFAKLMSNTEVLGGDGGCTFDATHASSARVLHVEIYDPNTTTWEDFGGTTLGASPRSAVAANAEKFAGKSSADFLQPNATAQLTQAKLEAFFQNITAATGNSVRWNGSGFIAYNPADGSNLQNGSVSDSALTGISWSKVTGVPQNLTDVGALSCTTGQIAQKSATGWQCVALPSITESDPSVKAWGKTDFDTTDFQTDVGDRLQLKDSAITPGAYPKLAVDQKGRAIAGYALSETDIPILSASGKVSGSALTGTIGGAVIVNTTGAVTSPEMTTKTLKVKNTTGTNSITLRAPSTLTDYTLTLPSSSGSAGEVLSTDGTGGLSWITPSGGGGGGAPTGAASGDLGGSYPNPSVTRLQGHLVSNSAPNPGDFFRYNGSQWGSSVMTVADVDNLQAQLDARIRADQMPSSCGPNQTLYFVSPTNAWTCANLVGLTSGSFRTTTSLTLYVRSTGSDSSCDGSSATVGSPPACPFATLKKALAAVPENVEHDVTIDVQGAQTLTETLVIGHRLHYGSGRLLKIEGTGGGASLLSDSSVGQAGMIVMAPARGVHLKGLTFTGFRGQSGVRDGTALRVDGGLVLLENVQFTNNSTALIAASGGGAHFYSSGSPSTNAITLASEDKAQGVVIRGGEFGGMTNTTLTVTGSGGRQEQRLIRLELGEGHFEGVLNLTMGSSCTNCSALEIERGSSFEVSGPATFDGSSPSGSGFAAIQARGGSFSFRGSGTLTVMNWGQGSALRAEDGGRVRLSGPVSLGGAGSSGTPISLRSQSLLQVHSHLTIQSSSSWSLVDLQNQSSALFESYGGTANWTFQGSGSGRAFSLDGQSLLTMSSNFSPYLSTTSLSTFVTASGGSRVAINRPTSMNFNSSSSLSSVDDIVLDKTSTGFVDSQITIPSITTTGGIGADSMPIFSASGSGSSYSIGPTINGFAQSQLFLFRISGSTNSYSPMVSVNGSSYTMYDMATSSPLQSGALQSGKIYKAYLSGSYVKVELPPPSSNVISQSVSQSISVGTSVNVTIPGLGSGQAAHCTPDTQLPDEVTYSTFIDSGILKLRLRNTGGATQNVNATFHCLVGE